MTPDEVLAARQAEVLDENPDAVLAALEKCKPAKHLRVVVRYGVTTLITARFVAELICRNAQQGPTPPTWGALLDPAGKQIGMHLFPDAVAMLAHQLPIVADEARAVSGVVAIQHTVKKSYATWRSVTPDDADSIAAWLGVMP